MLTLNGKFRPPICPSGLTVLWAPGPQGPWGPAVVTKPGGTAIDLSTIGHDARNLVPRSGVRHVSDPAFPRLIDQKGGVWDYTDEYKLLATLAQIVLPDDEGNRNLPTPEASPLRPDLAGLVYIPAPRQSYSDSEDDPDKLGY